jgi:hypothetical protein
LIGKVLKLAVSLALLALLVAAVTLYLWFREQREPFTPQSIARDRALQDETAVTIPPLRAARVSDGAIQPNPQRNLYFGELHLHTEQSFDAALFGTTQTITDAYRFARGEALETSGGELMRLGVPLDFVAITDHAEGFGSRRRCDEAGLPWKARAYCWVASTPNMATFKLLRKSGAKKEARGSRISSPYCQAVGVEQCMADARADWADYITLADAHNKPGEFTAFAAYEYSPTLPDYGKYHRNVYFRGSELPPLALSMLDVATAIDLWRGLEETCTGDCDFLTIPHNMNRAWGLPYGDKTISGGEYEAEDWTLRERREPLAEIYQIKGASECALGVFASDEECQFEQVFSPCKPGQETGCAFAGGFVREGLKRGLLVWEHDGLNPFRLGVVAATDGHNANPGDTEEWDFRGSAGSLTSPAARRRSHRTAEQSVHLSRVASRSSGGLAAVWATENTRDALFSAMQRRETYATSGTRIQLRLFGGWNYAPDSFAVPDVLAHADAEGVPMGGQLSTAPESRSPRFLVWALADEQSAPLQRIQMVKGWLEGGEAKERVMDIACADGLEPNPDTGRCPDNGATVNLETCAISAGSGAAELKVHWQDPDFAPAQRAFYYVRVLQNPTCRWTTYDSLRLGVELTPHAPPIVQERAWSSPVWYTPLADQASGDGTLSLEP